MAVDFCRAPYATQRSADASGPFELEDSDSALPEIPRLVLPEARVPSPSAMALTPPPFHPRPRFAEASDSDDLVLPDPDYVPPAPDDPDDEDWVHPAVGEWLMEPRAEPRSRPRLLSPRNLVPLIAAAPSTTLLDAQLLEAKDNLQQAVKSWKDKIAAQTADGKRRMEALLAEHAQELRAFHAEHGGAARGFNRTPRQAIRGVVDGSPVLKVRVGRRPQQLPSDIALTRKRIVDRHRSEIVALNAECEIEMRRIEERRDADVAAKRAAVVSIKGQLNQTMSFSCIPTLDELARRPTASSKVRPGAVVRLLLKPPSALCES